MELVYFDNSLRENENKSQINQLKFTSLSHGNAVYSFNYFTEDGKYWKVWRHQNPKNYLFSLNHYIVVAFASEIDCQVCPFDDAKM